MASKFSSAFIAATMAVALSFVAVPSLVSAKSSQSARTSRIAGTYEGEVKRRLIGGEQRETRIYRITMNADLSTGKLFIYELNRALRSELGFVVKPAGKLTYRGDTVPINTVPGYLPDHVTLTFAADGKSVKWFHADGTTEGTGTLARQPD